MIPKTLTIIFLPALALTMSTCGNARAGFISNGNFETTTGYGQMASSNYASGVTVANWSTASGYNFIFSASNASTGGVAGQYKNLQLWGPGNGSANGLTASPDGGNFIGADGAFEVSPITQLVNNLVVGQAYQVSFYWAGAQQYTFSGITTEQWQVSLGDQTNSTAVVTNASHGFTGWMSQSFNYVATQTSETLSFLAVGTPTGEPPFALLDGVTFTAVPEPSSLVLTAAGVLGFIVISRRRRTKVSIA